MILRPLSRMTTTPTLSAFLAKARASLAAPAASRTGPITFVVGNESADLDSLCSTIVLAYFKSQDTLHIPLSHLPRADLALRPEFTSVLEKGGLKPEELITLDELPDTEVLKPQDTRWMLVDHNVLTGKLGKLYAGVNNSRVVGCIDHHDDEGKLPEHCNPKIIEKTGSAMSLIIEHCKPIWESMTADIPKHKDEQALINHQLGHLIMAPILIDTTNLRDSNKTTSHDTSVVTYIETTKIAPFKKSQLLEPEYDRAEYFNYISLIKNDISKMSFRDIYRKDYKEWTENRIRLGTMSVPQPVDVLLDDTAHGDDKLFLDEFDAWMKEKDTDLAVIMSAYQDQETGLFARELYLWAKNGGQGANAARKFIEDYGEKLKLEAWRDGRLDADEGEYGFRRCWRQRTLENSRKQVAPMLREAMKGVA